MAAKKSGAKKAPSKVEESGRTTEGEKVAQTGANPAASRAGVSRVIERAGAPLRITVSDGARATIEVVPHDQLDQADLHSARQLLDQAIQETY